MLNNTNLNVINPQFSIAEKPKSGTATISIFDRLNFMPKYCPNNGRTFVVKSYANLYHRSKQKSGFSLRIYSALPCCRIDIDNMGSFYSISKRNRDILGVYCFVLILTVSYRLLLFDSKC